MTRKEKLLTLIPYYGLYQMIKNEKKHGYANSGITMYLYIVTIHTLSIWIPLMIIKHYVI